MLEYPTAPTILVRSYTPVHFQVRTRLVNLPCRGLLCLVWHLSPLYHGNTASLEGINLLQLLVLIGVLLAWEG